LVWHLVRDHYKPKVPEASWLKKPVERSLHTLAKSIRRLNMHMMLRGFEENKIKSPEEPQPEDPEEKDRWLKGKRDRESHESRKCSQNKAYEIETLFRIIPSLNELHASILDLNPGPFEGWAIWDKEANAVAANGMGFCFFEKREDVYELFEAWRKSESEYKESRLGSDAKPIDERLSVRPVRITVDKGVEFLDTNS
jgi:hypothetical protein